MFGRKGQGAMEYLMTYGWAILVVMIVGVVLWQLGIFGGGPGAVNTASGFGKLKIMEPSVKYEDTTLSFSIMNGVGAGIAGANITGATGDCSGATFPHTLSSGDGSDGAMGAGEVSAETLTCAAKATGQSFGTTLTAQYTVTVAGTDVVHTETGTIRGIAE